jgi:hypothetical protein
MHREHFDAGAACGPLELERQSRPAEPASGECCQRRAAACRDFRTHGETHMLHARSRRDAQAVAAEHAPRDARVLHFLEGDDVGIQFADVGGQARKVGTVAREPLDHVAGQCGRPALPAGDARRALRFRIDQPFQVPGRDAQRPRRRGWRFQRAAARQQQGQCEARPGEVANARDHVPASHVPGRHAACISGVFAKDCQPAAGILHCIRE